MPEYAYSKQDRERWAREAAAAVAAAAARVRGKMAARLDGKPLPSTVGAVFDQEEWEAELNGEIDAAFGSIAAESAEAFAEGVGARSRFSENAMKVMVGLIAAEVAGQLSTRGEVVADRIEQLMEKGETLEWDGARLAEELGLGEDLSGPLSDALAEAIGNSSATAITEGSAHGVIDLAGLVGNKTWHCVAPGTVVAAAGVTAVARKWFVGEMVRLSTRSGAILSVTPEHRVLVLGRGWVRADELMEGDELVSSRPTEGSTFGDPHIGDRVRVEEVFEASVEVTPSDRVPAVTVDFDGERVDEQVDVVRPARLLVDRLEAAFAEQASEDLLVLCDAGLARLLAGSDRFTLRQRPRSTLPDEDLALAETSNVDAGCSQPCSHSCAGHANFGTDLVARHPVLVEGHEPVGGHLVHAGGSAELAGSTGLLDRFGSSESDFGGRGSVAQHAMTSEAPTDRLGTHAQSGRHLRRSLAALVATDEVVLVERYGYEGHVYDLSTQRGWFLAESGIVVHNCMFRNSRDSHMDADLQTVPVDEPFELEGGPGMYPGDPDLPPEEAINCVMPDTALSAVGIHGGFRRWYSGPVVTVRARSGDDLTVTPNHPLLTGRGWVPAGEIEPGRDHVYRLIREGVGAWADPHVHGDSAVELFEAMQRSGAARRVPGLPVDFHGDGGETDVEVVAADGFLRSADMAALGEADEQVLLMPSDVLHGALSRLGLGLQLALAGGSGPAGSVGGAGDGRVAPLSGSLRLAAASQGDAGPLESIGDGPPVDAEMGRQRQDRLARLVAAHEVVAVDRGEWTGHVFNLQTASNWYLANGMITHNCQCWLTYSVELPSGETVEGEATADELEEGFAEALAAAGSIRSTLEVPSRRTLSTVTDLAVAPAGVQMITKGSPAAAWVAAAEEFGADLDGVIVSVEPTPLQKAALAVGGGEPPERLHVTLCALGAIDTLDEGARQIISSVLASFGPQVGPIEGSIGGIGWFGASDAMTLGLVDAPGLSSLRSVICNALADAGYAPLADHDFTPHVTLAYGQVDATDKVGQPVTFNELRLRWGAEVLAFDLIGSGAPPAAPEPLPEVPPAPPEEVPAVAVDTIPAPAAAAIAFADEPVESTQPPVDIASVPDDALAMELARRLANEAVRSVEDAGGVVSPAAHAMLEQEALHELDEALRDVIEDLTEDVNEPAEAEEPEEPAEVVAEMPTAAAIRARLRARAAALADVPMIGAEGEPIGEIVGAPVETVTCPECGMEVVATEEGLCPGCGAALTETEVVMASEVPDAEWEGVLTVEGVMSGDNRMIGEGSLTWRDLPVPLMLQTVNAPGHDGAVFCGWIHEVERVGASIIGRGTFTDDEAGAQARGILADPAGAKRFGVSVDIDSVQMVFADPSGVELSPDEAIEAHMFGGGADVVEMIVSGRVMGATLTPFPAFQEAHVYLLGPAEDAAEALVASAAGPIWRTTSPANLGLAGQGRLTALVASGGALDELHPSGDLFQLRPMDEPEPFSVGAPLPDGTIPCYGLVAQWGTCHIGDTARCTEVPRSNDFRSFYTGKKVLTAEGNLLSVGPIIMDTVHPNLWAQASDAQAFYAHTGCAVADVRLYTNEHGIVAAGVVSPDATPAQIRRLRASDISPDWRPMGGEHKLVSLLAVNTSGFLVEGIAASAGRFQPWGFIDLTTGKVGALVAAGAVRNPARRSMATELAEVRAELAEHRALLEALLAPHVEADRRARVAAALDAMGLDCGCDEPAREERLAAALAVFGD